MSFAFDKQLAEQELAKAFKLMSEGHAISMFSPAIDSVWHEKVENPSEYERFSLEVCGLVPDHEPSYGEGPVRWQAAYESTYGKFPSIWFMDEDGVLDEVAYRDYQEHGVIRACWRCVPCHAINSPAPVEAPPTTPPATPAAN